MRGPSTFNVCIKKEKRNKKRKRGSALLGPKSAWALRIVLTFHPFTAPMAGLSIGDATLVVLDVERGSVCLEKLRWAGKCVAYVMCVSRSAGICTIVVCD